MSKKLIFGHLNPDTDTICSALAYADLKTKLGENVEAVKLGPVNKETAHALEHFGVSAPRFIEKVDEDVEDVILVDHNEFQQSVSNIEDVNIVEVIDHHRVANFQTKNPLYFRAEPVGCTATIIKKIYAENKVEIPKDIAGLMLSAIVSDSLLFKSPTCTEEDVAAAKELAEIAEVDLEEYGLNMLKAGADISDKPVSEWISMDSKEFTMGGVKLEIAQVNTVDPAIIYSRQEEIEAEINRVIAEKDLKLFLFVVTDILNSDSEVLALGEEKIKVEEAFETTLDKNQRSVLKGVVSRKKQIVTNLTNAFEG